MEKMAKGWKGMQASLVRYSVDKQGRGGSVPWLFRRPRELQKDTRTTSHVRRARIQGDTQRVVT